MGPIEPYRKGGSRSQAAVPAVTPPENRPVSPAVSAPVVNDTSCVGSHEDRDWTPEESFESIFADQPFLRAETPRSPPKAPLHTTASQNPSDPVPIHDLIGHSTVVIPSSQAVDAPAAPDWISGDRPRHVSEDLPFASIPETQLETPSGPFPVQGLVSPSAVVSQSSETMDAPASPGWIPGDHPLITSEDPPSTSMSESSLNTAASPTPSEPAPVQGLMSPFAPVHDSASPSAVATPQSQIFDAQASPDWESSEFMMYKTAGSALSGSLSIQGHMSPSAVAQQSQTFDSRASPDWMAIDYSLIPSEDPPSTSLESAVHKTASRTPSRPVHGNASPSAVVTPKCQIFDSRESPDCMPVDQPLAAETPSSAFLSQAPLRITISPDTSGCDQADGHLSPAAMISQSSQAVTEPEARQEPTGRLRSPTRAQSATRRLLSMAAGDLYIEIPRRKIRHPPAWARGGEKEGSSGPSHRQSRANSNVSNGQHSETAGTGRMHMPRRVSKAAAQNSARAARARRREKDRT